MKERREFVKLASTEGANVRELCRRFGVSPTTGYEYLQKYREGGFEGLEDRSRKPKRSPKQTPAAIEEKVVELRSRYHWGGRKIRKTLLRELAKEEVPSAATITAILHRKGLIESAESEKREAFKRFERSEPNDLWQMDFKGPFAMNVARCHPLTVIDDHSRYSLRLSACGDERRETVEAHLTDAFRKYGLPIAMTMDNGAPWGSDADRPHTAFTAWLMRLGIRVSHSRPYHPQTQGKDERFHRTLIDELLKWESFSDLVHAQRRFDEWREIYNYVRPHEALGDEVPASRFRVSNRAFPERLSPIEYDWGEVRVVDPKGHIRYRGGRFLISKAFVRQPVCIRPTDIDGLLDVYFCSQRVRQLDLQKPIDQVG